MCYTDQQMAAALRRAGVGAGDAAYLVATAHPESGGCNVIQQGQPYGTTGWGVWQITPGNSEPQYGTNNALLSLQPNADAAAAKLRSQGLGAWTTITSGAYGPYFSAAKNAVSSVYAMSEAEVNKLVQNAGKGGTSQAQTTSFTGSIGNLLGLNQFIPDLTKSIIGNTNVKDLLIRGGLIILGGLMLLIGIIMLAGKSANTAVQVIAPESRLASVTGGTVGREAAARRMVTAREGARTRARTEAAYETTRARERARRGE